MAIENAADLVQFLAEELRQRGTRLHEFSEMTGISEERLEYLQAGAWHRLTVKEIGAMPSACMSIAHRCGHLSRSTETGWMNVPDHRPLALSLADDSATA